MINASDRISRSIRPLRSTSSRAGRMGDPAGGRSSPVGSVMVVAGRGGAADGEATRQALLDAAARLFADVGIEAVSLRAVNLAAGAAPAAVDHHFGLQARLGWKRVVEG